MVNNGPGCVNLMALGLEEGEMITSLKPCFPVCLGLIISFSHIAGPLAGEPVKLDDILFSYDSFVEESRVVG